MIHNLFDRIVRKPPVLFPLVALFHLVMLLVTAWQFAAQGVLGSREGMIAVSVWALFTVLWLFICDMKRWAAIAYVVCSLAGLCGQFLTTKDGVWYELGTVLFPFDLLMIVFLMFYYKRFA